MKYNYHTHTIRCGHASGTDEEYVEASIKAGMNRIGFADHIPFKSVSLPKHRMNYNMKEDYYNSINDLKEKYKNIIDVKLGFEADYIEEEESTLLELSKEVDYLILGEHYYLLYGKPKDFISNLELEYMLKLIEKAYSLGIYTYHAHPDYFLRERPRWDEAAERCAHKIAELSLKYDMPLELNLKGTSMPEAKDREVMYPYIKFWKIISKYNCKVVIGYDAHNPQALLEEYPIIEEYKNKLNLNFIDLNI